MRLNQTIAVLLALNCPEALTLEKRYVEAGGDGLFADDAVVYAAGGRGMWVYDDSDHWLPRATVRVDD